MNPDDAVSATAMAHFLDEVLLAPLANASASTGLVLSLGTAWGLVHQRWVLTKFAITLGQLYTGMPSCDGGHFGHRGHPDGRRSATRRPRSARLVRDPPAGSE
jgi:hypothetical protein